MPILLALIGWLLGVHLAWPVILLLLILSFIHLYKTEGLQGLALLPYTLAFSISMTLAAFMYGDFSSVVSNWDLSLNYLFTGNN